MIPARRHPTCCWDVVGTGLGRVPRRPIWTSPASEGQGHRTGVVFAGTLATKVVLLPRDPESKGIVERRPGPARLQAGGAAPVPVGPEHDGHRPRPRHRSRGLRHAYQHPRSRPEVEDMTRDPVTDPIRRAVAAQVGGLLWAAQDMSDDAS